MNLSEKEKRLFQSRGVPAFVAVDPWGGPAIWSVARYARNVREQIVDIYDDKPWSFYYREGWRVRRCRVLLEYTRTS